jgi:hypothetical protein
LIPRTLKGYSWVEEGQTGAGNNEHDSFHDHEDGLVASEKCATKATRELNASVDTSAKESQRRDNKTDEESFEE